MKQHINILLAFLFISCHSNTSHKVVISEANYDTLPNGQRLLDNIDSAIHLYHKEVVGSDTLIGGYIICYAIDDSTKYFYLRKGDTLHLLNKVHRLSSAHSLGYLEEDYKTFFITKIDNGNGVPFIYQIFDKKTGQNIMGNYMEFEDYTEFNGKLYILYRNYLDSIVDKLILYRVADKKKKVFALPKKLPEELEMKIEDLTRKKLTVSYSSFIEVDSMLQITYYR